MTTAAKPVTETTAPRHDGEHDAWVHEQVTDTLKAKADGRLTYKTFDEVAAKFGFHAR